MSKTEVYANGLEIACKASDGKSTASFPDPCYSPPSPRSGWKVVPYANTAKASDTANGSKTVFIKGKPVMLKDKSYFSTSTGNEGAAGPLGVATGVKKGKAYFTNWPLDVKIEGYPCSDECLKEQLSNAYKHCNDNFTAQLITGNRGEDTRTVVDE